MAALDPKQHLIGFTKLTSTRLANDLKALDAEKSVLCPGGSGRTPVHIVAECALVNRFVAGWLKTGETNRGSSEEREKIMTSYDTKEKALALLEEETQNLLAVLESLDPATLGDESEQPLGRPMSRFAVAELPAAHMMYHDGQLNYIHTLHDDTDMHW